MTEVTSMNLFSLDGRTAIVTGASRGLGRSMALALAEAGANVVLVARDIGLSEQVANDVQKFGTQAIAIKCDISKETEILKTAKMAINHFGKVDILVNNAGINILRGILEFTRENWLDLLDTNLLGGYFFCKAVCPYMIERKRGAIINHASILASVVMPERAAYSATKAGVAQLTKCLAVELAQFNIRANALCTGTMETDLVKKIIGEGGNFDYFVKVAPMKRIGQPDEIGGAVVFLASDAASFITGTTIYVDGGYTAV
jgi:NAD(P)-dependent dehydrogenase (short-subunit alcohol dehydrogenase family)